MIVLDRVESAVSRVEQAKRLIQQARLARMSAEARIQLLQDQIDTTQSASGAAVHPTHQMNAVSDPANARAASRDPEAGAARALP